ncbi:hypothetical protein EVAR_28719_1 [Eumeta japonica]|uniref:Uncharacterized protein n=1 Tax=Eumeta variegata TaxID=151549 RepID=A0A4C1V6C1_EUMVA|nr:hypothetical protein EVAR_28719_1 [Eumeta japonica]
MAPVDSTPVAFIEELIQQTSYTPTALSISDTTSSYSAAFPTFPKLNTITILKSAYRIAPSHRAKRRSRRPRTTGGPAPRSAAAAGPLLTLMLLLSCPSMYVPDAREIKASRVVSSALRAPTSVWLVKREIDGDTFLNILTSRRSPRFGRGAGGARDGRPRSAITLSEMTNVPMKTPWTCHSGDKKKDFCFREAPGRGNNALSASPVAARARTHAPSHAGGAPIK